MEEKPITNKFKFSYGTLLALGDTCLSLYERDFAVLEGYGINENFRLAVEAKLEASRDFPTDEEFAGEAIDLCETKDKNADDLRVLIRTVMSRVENVFKPGSGKWKRFDTKGLSHMNDHLLARCGFRVVRMCNVYLTQLAPKGITPALLTELHDLSTKFYNSWDEFHDAELNRICVTTERLTLGNELYDLITEMFGYGKDYWSTRNYAKYKAYIIYDTPSGKPDKEDEKPEDKTQTGKKSKAK
jgi:hypothetical protein